MWDNVYSNHTLPVATIHSVKKLYIYFIVSADFPKVPHHKIVNLVSQASILILVTFSARHTQKEYLTTGTVFKSIATGGCTEYLDVSV